MLCLPAIDASAQGPIAPARAADYASWNIPQWAARRFEDQKVSQRYEIVLEVNPFMQRGDFDGDGQPDIAMLVRHRQTGTRGIVILHQGHATPHVMGAGTTFGNGGDDWNWLWVWRVEPALTVAKEFPPSREALYVAKPEAAGALLYWDGQRYRWRQAGD